MRQPFLPGTLALIAFWVVYAIGATYMLYEKTPPVGRFLLLVLGGYALMLAVLTIIVLRQPRPPQGSRSLRN